MELYRYRKFENALREIKNQTIYFAAKEELNDPIIEGYIDLYWQGDEIAWNGLFKNYVCSLYQTLTLYLLKATEDDIRKNAAISDIHNFDDKPLGKILKNLCNTFLKRDNIKKIIKLFAEKHLQISKDELTVFLSAIHIEAIIDCLDCHLNNVYYSQEMEKFSSELKKIRHSQFNIPETLFNVKNGDFRQEAMHMFCNYIRDNNNQIYVSLSSDQEKAWFTIISDFFYSYVVNLEKFIHPEVYISCFSLDGKNGAMWGKYADNHTGVCMIYETHNINNNETIALFKPYSYSSDIGEEYKYRDEILYKIKYGGNVSKANFFTMLGRLNGKQLHSWLSDDNGNRSECLNEIYSDEDEWRKKYWQCLYDRYCHKTAEWEHEQEYRLLLINSFFDYSVPKKRCIKYHFSNLKGVILGMNTTPEQRIKIIDAIRKKCEENGRSDFEIYVAEYSPNHDSIINRNLNI